LVQPKIKILDETTIFLTYQCPNQSKFGSTGKQVSNHPEDVACSTNNKQLLELALHRKVLQAKFTQISVC